MKQKKLVIQLVLISALLFISVFPGLAAAETLKIGALGNLGWTLGVDFKKFLDVAVPEYNKKGGLMIDGKKYDVEVIFYDSKNNPETGRAAVERLVHQDKVKFIVGDETVDAWLPVTEPNKVVSVVMTPSPAIHKPDFKYVFGSTFLNTRPPAIWGWFSQTHPNVKTWSGVFWDDMLGHILAKQCQALGNSFGQKALDVIFAPNNTIDFSAITTKINASKPDMFVTLGMGEIPAANIMKGLNEVGWKGQYFFYVGIQTAILSTIIPLSMIEGMITSEDGIRLESPPPLAKELREKYIAKYGKWDDPSTLFINTWYCLISGLQQAKSLDPDKVAAVIGGGMKYETTEGSSRMVSRQDMGNSRTTDAVFPSNATQLVKGKMKLIKHLSVEDSLESSKKFYHWK